MADTTIGRIAYYPYRNLAQDEPGHRGYDEHLEISCEALCNSPRCTLARFRPGGKLIFPATKYGKGILEGATKLTLTISNEDAPSRVFEWQLE